jgi:hypothetical protein
MIVWINGTFGVGKATTSRALLPLVPQSRIFDSEYVGMMLRHVLATEPVNEIRTGSHGERFSSRRPRRFSHMSAVCW